MSNNADGRQKVFGSEDIEIQRFDQVSSEYAHKYRHRRIWVEEVNAFCFLFHAKLLEKIGDFDTNYRTEKYTLKDYCLRASLMGMQNALAGDVYVHHEGGHSKHHFFTTGGEDSCADRAVYASKWEGFEIGGPVDRALKAERILREAWLLFQQGKIDSAINLYLQGIGHDPGNAGFYVGLAEQLKNAGQFQAALEALGEMPEPHNMTDSLQKKVFVLKGYCEIKMGAVEQAESHADQALKIDPTDAPAQNLKGMLACEKGDTGKAIKFFRQSLDSDPGYGEAYTNLGVLYWDKGEKDRSFNWLKKGFILNPLDLDIADLFQAAATALNKFETVETIVRNAAAIYPESKRLQFMAADLLIHLGKNFDAIDVIENSIIRFGFDNDLLTSARKVRESLGPVLHEPGSPSRTSVSLCMIVKNEEKFLHRCLATGNRKHGRRIWRRSPWTDRRSLYRPRSFHRQWVSHCPDSDVKISPHF
jgi:tetratricopeptide (TPR) repeat protein